MVMIGDMEIRVIHLARATARRERMEAEFSRAGVPVTAWGAVDGRDPAQSARLASLPDEGPWGPMDAHAKGCLLSHLDALRAFVDGPASHLLVLEDDVFVAEDLRRWLAGDWWPAQADIVKIERWRDDRLLVLVDRETLPCQGRRLHRLRTRHSGSAGYIVSRAVAGRILAEGRSDLPVDQLLFNPAVSGIARKLRVYQVMPALVEQGNEPVAQAIHVPQPSAVPAKRGLSPRQKLTRAIADLWALAHLPRLVSGKAMLTRVAFMRLPPEGALMPGGHNMCEVTSDIV